MRDILALVRVATAAIVIGSCLITTGSALPEPLNSQKKRLKTQVTYANAQFASGRFGAGLQGFQAALSSAQRSGDLEWSIKLESNIGGAYYALYRYQEAIQSFLAARNQARTTGRQTLAAVIDVNLASLYIVVGDLDAANQAAEESLHTAGASELQGHRYQLLACLAELRAKQGRNGESVHYFLEAVRSADRAADTAFVARIWEHLGEFMLREGDSQAAEGPLLEAFRLRTLFHDRDLRVSLLNVAWLRLEQGNLRSGSALLERAEAMPQTDAGAPPWFVSFLRGRLAEKRGESKAALRSYGDAFQEAVQWQEEVGPSDSLRGVSFIREEFQRIYESLTETSLVADPNQALDAFEATEEYRAAALRQTLANKHRWIKDMPPEYWSLLGHLRAAEIVQLTDQSEANLSIVASLRRRLVEVQSEHSPVETKTFEKYTPGQTLTSIQASLRPEEALLSFYVGPGSGALWAVTKQRIKRYPLPSAATLGAMASQFRADIQNRRPSRVALPLYRALFQNLDPDFLSRTTWIVSATDVIFSIPFIALEVGSRGGKPVYLLEEHVVLHTPSASMLTPSGDSVHHTRRFVGLGDGIYNSADARWHSMTVAFRRFAPIQLGRKPFLQLPRLAGSGAELDACALQWGGTEQPLLLKGGEASSGSLRAVLRTHPAVLHLAAHVIALSADHPEQSAIDLGMNVDGRPDVLTSDDIAALDASNTMIVMSGCSSANAPAISGVGVLGLTRAWLLAGARVVIGSRWPTPDDTGELFQSFYQHLRKVQDNSDRTRAVARSLRAAQLDMLRSNTWRSSPWYWSAFYALGKE